MRSWMVTGLPDELQSTLDAATASESFEEMTAVLAANLVPLSNITYIQAVSFISVILATEGETDSEGQTTWEHDGASITLIPYGIVPDGALPEHLVYALIGYCYANDIPFLGCFGSLGNLIPEFAFKAKAQEKEARIAAIYSRAEANVENPEILAECVEDLATLDAPPPKPGTALAQAISEMMEPELRESLRN